MTLNSRARFSDKYNEFTSTCINAYPEIVAIRESAYNLIESLSGLTNLDRNNELPITPDLSLRISSAPEFLKTYYHLILRLKAIFNKEFSFQKIPTLRLLNKNDSGHRYHIDTWAGYDPSIFTFWAPLSCFSSSSCLHLLSGEASHAALSKFTSHGLTLSEFSLLASPQSSPPKINLGDLVCFGSHIVHGSNSFEDVPHRISIDFRLSFLPPAALKASLRRTFLSSSSLTSLSEYHELDAICSTSACELIYDSNSEYLLGVNCIYFSNLEHQHISHSFQRSILRCYCNLNNFVMARSYSEIHGSSHCPQLQDVLLKYPFVPIVLFSIRSYDIFCDETFKVIKQLEYHRMGAYFALENIFIAPGFFESYRSTLFKSCSGNKYIAASNPVAAGRDCNPASTR